MRVEIQIIIGAKYAPIIIIIICIITYFSFFCLELGIS
jgi:hypothetical protein